jgi:hypothetical protein
VLQPARAEAKDPPLEEQWLQAVAGRKAAEAVQFAAKMERTEPDGPVDVAYLKIADANAFDQSFFAAQWDGWDYLCWYHLLLPQARATRH